MKKKAVLPRALMVTVLCLSMTAGNVFAAEQKSAAENTKTEAASEEKVISYDEAVEMAIKNNSSLKSLADNVEYMEDTQESLVQNMGQTMPQVDGTIFADSTRLSFLTGLDSILTGLSSSRYSEQMTKESAEFSVLSYFTKIKSDESSLAMLKDSYALAMQDLSNAQLKYNLGMISESDLVKQRTSVAQTKEKISLLELQLKSDYLGLNNLLGLKADEEYSISYSAEFVPFKMDTDLETYITKSMASNPYLKVQEKAVDSTEFDFNVNPTDSASNWKKKELNLKEAQRNFKDLKTDTANNMRTTYASLQQLEANQKSYEAALTAAENDYKVAQANYEVGNITKLALDQAALGVQSAKNDLESNIYNYEQLKFTMEHSFMLSMGGGGSASGSSEGSSEKSK